MLNCCGFQPLCSHLILQLTVKTALISHSETIFVCGAAHLYSFAAVSTAVTEAVGDGLVFEMKAEVFTGARRSFRDHRPDGETERVIHRLSPPHGLNMWDLTLPDLKRWEGPIYDLRAISWGPFQIHFNSSSSRHLHTQHRCQFGEILLVHRTLRFVMLHLRSIKSIKHISTVWRLNVMSGLMDCDSSQGSLAADG